MSGFKLVGLYEEMLHDERIPAMVVDNQQAITLEDIESLDIAYEIIHNFNDLILSIVLQWLSDPEKSLSNS